MTTMQRELSEVGPLLDADGRLHRPGWLRQPLLDANLERAAPGVLRRLRLKQWDYYGVWTPDLYVSATVSHVGYAGLVFFYIVDLVGGGQVDHTITLPFGRGLHLPTDSRHGETTYAAGGTRVAFRTTANVRVLDVTDPAFDGGRGLRIDVTLACPSEHESIVMATPMGGDRFYYNRKLNGLRAAGRIVWGDRAIDLDPARALGQLDWGRGVWPYRSHWIWASANGFLPNGRVVGLNLGGGFGDLSHATENTLFVDGRAHKLGGVTFAFDPRDYTRPWRMTDDAGRLDVTLTPHVERVARTSLLVIRSEVHQMFGHYAGHVVTDAGERINLHALPGFAEEHYARW